jgi:hypothetical protein
MWFAEATVQYGRLHHLSVCVLHLGNLRRDGAAL